MTAGQQIANWRVISVDGKLATISCSCGEVFVAYLSTVANRIQRARSRGEHLYCVRGRCRLRIAGRHLQALRSTAKRRGIRVELTVADVFRLRVGKVCIYCGGKLPQWGGGLDRKDNRQPYTSSNCVPCCESCNTAKSSFLSYDEFLAAMRVRTTRVGVGNAWPVTPVRALRPRR